MRSESQPYSNSKEARNQEWNEAKAKRHLDNLQHFTGYFHGTFFWDGVGQTKNGNNKISPEGKVSGDIVFPSS